MHSRPHRPASPAVKDEEPAGGRDREASCGLAAAWLAIDDFWAGQLQGYREPQLIVVEGSAPTPYGTASNATGPFCCLSDETVYVAPTFFGIPPRRGIAARRAASTGQRRNRSDPSV